MAFVLAACGRPPGPQHNTEPGALSRAIAQSSGAPAAAPDMAAQAPIPYVIITFDGWPVNFKDALYSALSRALNRYPAAAFDVVLAMPPLTPDDNAAKATARAERRIEEVVLLMTDMGLPSERIRIGATTDAAAKADEIRIFVH